METYEDTGEAARAFSQVLELPVRQDSSGMPAPYNPNDVVFMDLGACKSQDPSLFNTNTNHGKTALRGTVLVGGRRMRKRDQIALARSVCGACPVLVECAGFIARYPEGEGVWAGTLPEERRRP